MMKKHAKKYMLLLLSSIVLHLGFFYMTAMYFDFIFLNELHKRLNHKIVDKTKDLSTQIELVDIDRKQVVDQNKKSINDKAPKDSKFVSRNDQTVKKETKAQKTGAFQNSQSMPKPQPSNPTQASKEQPMVTATELLSAPIKTPSTSLNKGEKDLGLQGLKSSMNKNVILKRRMKQMQTLAAAKNMQSEQARGPSQRDDHLEDIDDGEFTLLNTRRTKYYSFYSRIKGQLRSHWNPLIREEVSFIYSTQRSPASLGLKKTSVQITLNKDGYLEEIALLKTSGNKAIDTAAIQALRLAAPFPNPPEEMLEKDNKIRIFWDFVLES